MDTNEREDILSRELFDAGNDIRVRQNRILKGKKRSIGFFFKKKPFGFLNGFLILTILESIWRGFGEGWRKI